MISYRIMLYGVVSCIIYYGVHIVLYRIIVFHSVSWYLYRVIIFVSYRIRSIHIISCFIVLGAILCVTADAHALFMCFSMLAGFRRSWRPFFLWLFHAVLV